MRRARITYQGAFHHGMNRGYGGLAIFLESKDKKKFLELLAKNSDLYKTRIFAFCLMDNHYHLILENSTNRLSEFFKQLNSQIAIFYRKNNGGRGYVFQDRFKSMLIQDDTYLMMAIAYILANPVRAGLVKSFSDYQWSSGNLYFSRQGNEIVDTAFIEELFGSKTQLESWVKSMYEKELPIIKSKVGLIIGEERFIAKAFKRFERRSDSESLERKRVEDQYFEPVEKVFSEFEQRYQVKTDEVDTSTHTGKRQRGILLVNLKDRAGLRYKEIIKLDIFSDVKINTLGSMYQRAKRRLDQR